MRKLYNIKLINTGSGATVYHENLSFTSEPTNEDIIGFMSLIRPTLRFDYIEWNYVVDLDERTGHSTNQTKSFKDEKDTTIIPDGSGSHGM